MVNYSIITPNLCDDGHSACTGLWQGATCNGSAGDSPKHDCAASSTTLYKQADAWLRVFLGTLLNASSSYYSNNKSTIRTELNHTVFFILYDEADPSTSADYYKGFTATNEATTTDNHKFCSTISGAKTGTCGGAVFLTIVNPGGYLAKNLTYYKWKPESSDYGLLATVELIFDLRGVAQNVTTPTGHGLCSIDTTANTLTNPGCLDTLWIGHNKDLNDFNPLLNAFGIMLTANGNHY